MSACALESVQVKPTMQERRSVSVTRCVCARAEPSRCRCWTGSTGGWVLHLFLTRLWSCTWLNKPRFTSESFFFYLKSIDFKVVFFYRLGVKFRLITLFKIKIKTRIFMLVGFSFFSFFFFLQIYWQIKCIATRKAVFQLIKCIFTCVAKLLGAFKEFYYYYYYYLFKTESKWLFFFFFPLFNFVIHLISPLCLLGPPDGSITQRTVIKVTSGAAGSVRSRLQSGQAWLNPVI